MKMRMLSRLFFLFLLPTCPTLSQWQQIPSLVGVPVTCMITTDDSTILVGGMMGTLLRSTDNGTTWTSVWGNGISIDTILSLGAGWGYIYAGADRYNSVFRSSNDGISWNLLDSLEQRAFGFTYVETILFAATDWGVYRSPDHGDSWSADTVGLGYDPAYPAGYSNATLDIVRAGPKLYAFKDFAKGIYSTRADTVHWFPVGMKVWHASLATIDTNLFAATDGGVFMYGGSDTTWNSRNNGLPGHLSFPILRAVDSLLFLFTGSVNEIYVSGDLGLHWELFGTSDIGNKTIESIASTKTHVIAQTSIDTWRLAANDVLLSTGNTDQILPIGFHLEQNFPNPFNPGTTIRYQLSAVSMVKLSVFDVLGREIAVIVNEQKSAGRHTVTWNAGNRPSGVYLLRLQTGGFVQTRKMVLVW